MRARPGRVSNLRIRRARPGEGRALTALAFRSKAVWGHDEAFMRKSAPDLTITAGDIAVGRVYVAESHGQVLGFCGLSAPGDSPELNHLFVEPGALRKGIGARLLRHARRQARRFGWRGFRIGSDPQALAFYEREGATQIGTVRSIVGGGRRLPLLWMIACANRPSARMENGSA